MAAADSTLSSFDCLHQAAAAIVISVEGPHPKLCRDWGQSAGFLSYSYHLPDCKSIMRSVANSSLVNASETIAAKNWSPS